MHQQVSRVADMVGMSTFLSSSPFELSGGQKQRTSLAGVMVNDVDIFLFDEPLANLDPATGKTAIEIIDDIQKVSGKTIIIIEHRLEDVLHRFFDRIIALNEGRIIADMDAHSLVSSDILIKTGIREPLYVTAMKYAGVDVKRICCPVTSRRSKPTIAEMPSECGRRGSLHQNHPPKSPPPSRWKMFHFPMTGFAPCYRI